MFWDADFSQTDECASQFCRRREPGQGTGILFCQWQRHTVGPGRLVHVTCVQLTTRSSMVPLTCDALVHRRHYRCEADCCLICRIKLSSSCKSPEPVHDHVRQAVCSLRCFGDADGSLVPAL